MAHYIDGFVHPIPSDKLDSYKHLAKEIAAIWKEHGALAYWEYAGDDMYLEGTRSFTDLLSASEDETILFGWVVFDSRETRDQANQKVAADPRIPELMGAIDSSFEGARMAYGGFNLLVETPTPL